MPHHTSIIVTSSFFLPFQQPSHTLGDKDFVGLQQRGYQDRLIVFIASVF